MKRLLGYAAIIALLLGGAYFFVRQSENRNSAPSPLEEKPRQSSSAPKADGKLILALGDSLTAGYGLPANQSFAAQLEAVLNAKGITATVHNGGVSGDTSAAGLARLTWTLDSLARKPDLVILELGANDMLRGLALTQTRNNLEAIITALKQRNIPILLAGMRASPNLGAEYVAVFDALYPALAKKHGLPLYPFFMDGVAANSALLLPDGMHPTDKGVAIIVGKIMPQIEKALER